MGVEYVRKIREFWNAKNGVELKKRYGFAKAWKVTESHLEQIETTIQSIRSDKLDSLLDIFEEAGGDLKTWRKWLKLESENMSPKSRGKTLKK